MRTITLIALFGFLLSAIFFGVIATESAQSLATTTPASPSDKSQSNAQVLVTIVGKAGSSVLKPSSGDFLVLDDNHPVEVRDVRSVKEEPLTFSLLVDASGSRQSASHSQTSGAAKLFKALSNQNSRGYLILFRVEVASDDKPIDADTAEKLLIHEDSRRGATSLFDAIVHAASNQLTLAKSHTSARRAIFVFSDGGDNTSLNSLEQTIRVLQRECIPVFPIVMNSKNPDKRGLTILRALARNTGGDLVAFDESGDFVSRVLGYIDSQYILSFSMFPEKYDKPHSLEIKSVSGDVEMSSPTKYVAR
jgi:VWFA-related protein